MTMIIKLLKYSILKTLYFNFKYFSFFSAIKLPILITKNVYLKEVKGEVVINSPIHTGMIVIGSYGVGIFDEKRSRAIWQVSGTIMFNGTCNVGHGSKISISEKAILSLGENFKITAETTIVCTDSIKIGNNCLISWDILIMDTDFHKIKDYNGDILNYSKPIIIEDNVWVGCRSTILKGASIPKNSIIGAGSIVSKKMKIENAIYSGAPCSLSRENVVWEE